MTVALFLLVIWTEVSEIGFEGKSCLHEVMADNKTQAATSLTKVWFFILIEGLFAKIQKNNGSFSPLADKVRQNRGLVQLGVHPIESFL